MSDFSNGAAVREWAKANSVDAGGERGRLPKSTIEAFNDANPNAPYKVADRSDGTVQVTGTVERELSNGKTRKMPLKRTVNVSAARAWAKQNGFESLGDRGRVPQDALLAYAAQLPAKGKSKTPKASD